jgi:hypothetical protein
MNETLISNSIICPSIRCLGPANLYFKSENILISYINIIKVIIYNHSDPYYSPEG